MRWTSSSRVCFLKLRKNEQWKQTDACDMLLRGIQANMVRGGEDQIWGECDHFGRGT